MTIDRRDTWTRCDGCNALITEGQRCANRDCPTHEPPEAIKIHGRWRLANVAKVSDYGATLLMHKATEPPPDPDREVWSEHPSTGWLGFVGDEEVRIKLEEPPKPSHIRLAWESQGSRHFRAQLDDILATIEPQGLGDGRIGYLWRVFEEGKLVFHGHHALSANAAKQDAEITVNRILYDRQKEAKAASEAMPSVLWRERQAGVWVAINGPITATIRRRLVCRTMMRYAWTVEGGGGHFSGDRESIIAAQDEAVAAINRILAPETD